jgi:molybdopterin-guanine dinucleotide biosynthesis protein A
MGYPKHEITGVILAGGRARRMGGVDKGLTVLAGRPMLQHVLAALQPQVAKVIINANRNLDVYRGFGCDVVSDVIGDYSGPLAGMASGMQSSVTPYIVTVPCDSPLIAGDLVARLYRTLKEQAAEVCVVHDGERTHPVFLMLRCDLVGSVLAYLDAGERKIDKWFAQHHLAVCDFSDQREAFMNVNHPQELDALEQSIANR